MKTLYRLLAPRADRSGNLERGDTLVEVLVAVVILGLAVIGLMGSLLTSTAASTTNRSLATVDSVLKSFVNTARSTIETQASGGGSGPQYVACATGSSYTVVGAPIPRSGPPGTVITVFSTTAFPLSGYSYVLLSPVAGGAAVTAPATYTAGPLGAQAGATIQFTVPAALAAGAYSVAPFQKTTVAPYTDTTDTTATYLTVTSGGAAANGALYKYFSLQATVQYWTGSSWSTNPADCHSSDPNSKLQQLTYTVVDSQPNRGSADDLSIAVGNFKNESTPGLTVSCATGGSPCSAGTTYPLGTHLTFTATLTGDAGAPGTLSWSGLPAAVAADCPSGSISGGTAVCDIPVAVQGSYQPTATYSGDSSFSGVAASPTDAYTVGTGPTTVTVTSSPSTPKPSPQNITFTAQINGVVPLVTPGGTVTWSLSTPSGFSGSSTCNGSKPAPTASPYQLTCTVTGATSGTYSLTATYSGDSNYVGSSGSGSELVQYSGTPSIVISPSQPPVGSTFSFVATITQPSGAPAPTGKISFAGSNLPASCNSGTSLPATAPFSVSCTISSAQKITYSATATFTPGDTNYTAGTSTTSTISVLYSASPTVACTVPAGCNSASQNPGTSLTFQATLTQPAGAPAPTGNLKWTLSTTASGTITTTCNSTVPLPASGPYTFTCSVSNAPAGNYTVTAQYLGDTNYYNQSGSTTVTVKYGAMSVVCSVGCSSKKNNVLTFTAQITPPNGAPAPTGTVTWSLTLTDNKGTNAVSCDAPASQTSGWPASPGPYTVTCTINSDAAGTYNVTASYPGDGNYATQNPSTSVVISN